MLSGVPSSRSVRENITSITAPNKLSFLQDWKPNFLYPGGTTIEQWTLRKVARANYQPALYCPRLVFWPIGGRPRLSLFSSAWCFIQTHRNTGFTIFARHPIAACCFYFWLCSRGNTTAWLPSNSPKVAQDEQWTTNTIWHRRLMVWQGHMDIVLDSLSVLHYRYLIKQRRNSNLLSSPHVLRHCLLRIRPKPSNLVNRIASSHAFGYLLA